MTGLEQKERSVAWKAGAREQPGLWPQGMHLASQLQACTAALDTCTHDCADRSHDRLPMMLRSLMHVQCVHQLHS